MHDLHERSSLKSVDDSQGEKSEISRLAITQMIVRTSGRRGEAKIVVSRRLEEISSSGICIATKDMENEHLLPGCSRIAIRPRRRQIVFVGSLCPAFNETHSRCCIRHARVPLIRRSSCGRSAFAIDRKILGRKYAPLNVHAMYRRADPTGKTVAVL